MGPADHWEDKPPNYAGALRAIRGSLQKQTAGHRIHPSCLLPLRTLHRQEGDILSLIDFMLQQLPAENRAEFHSAMNPALANPAWLLNRTQALWLRRYYPETAGQAMQLYSQLCAMFPRRRRLHIRQTAWYLGHPVRHFCAILIDAASWTNWKPLPDIYALAVEFALRRADDRFHIDDLAIERINTLCEWLETQRAVEQTITLQNRSYRDVEHRLP